MGYIDLELIPGRNNLACTIMVPWACRYKCPFCTTRYEYEKTSPNINNIAKAITKLGNTILFNSGMINEFVITGGEPFDRPYNLLAMVTNLSKYELPIYINTILPAEPIIGNKSCCNRIFNLASGINISRHLTNIFPFSDSDNSNNALSCIMWRDLIAHENVKINSVITESDFTDDLSERIREFVDTYRGWCKRISFRADYNKIKTTEDLKTHSDTFFRVLFRLYPYEYSSGCAVCNDDNFGLVSYHRGLSKTLVNIAENKYLVHDIIIRPDGDIWPDWIKPSESVMDSFKFYLEDKNKFEEVFTQEVKDSLNRRKTMNSYTRRQLLDSLGLSATGVPDSATTSVEKSNISWAEGCGSSPVMICGKVIGYSRDHSSGSCGSHSCGSC